MRGRGRARPPPFPQTIVFEKNGSLAMSAIAACLPESGRSGIHQKGGSGPQKTRLTRHSRALSRFPTLAVRSFGWTSTRSAFCTVHMEGKQPWQSWGDIFGNADCRPPVDCRPISIPPMNSVKIAFEFTCCQAPCGRSADASTRLSYQTHRLSAPLVWTRTAPQPTKIRDMAATRTRTRRSRGCTL